MKIGYKGTDKDLKCKGVQFEVGKTYYIDSNNKVAEIGQDQVIITNKGVKLCSTSAIHYCNKLEDVFQHYSNNGSNRFFEVEIIGEFVDDEITNKSGTRSLKFKREISEKEMEVLREERKSAELYQRLKIDTVKKLQIKYPNLLIGGSISLYLQGVYLERFVSGEVDFDITLPYFQLLESEEDITVSSLEDRPSGSDYEETMLINGVKADIRIDPKQKYEIVEYKDFKFKVIPLHTIIEAKARYANTVWGEKHRNDLKEMILNK